MTAHVVVVGGGLAGASAALTLADAGVRVTLLERRGHLGGLTTSVERDGYSFDNGQHVFLGCCSAYRSLLERVGAWDQVYLQERLDMPVIGPGGLRGTIRRTGLPAPLHLAASLMTYRLLSRRERLALVGAVLALSRVKRDDPTTDAINFGDWLRRRHQSERAIARLWNLIIQPTLNVSVDDASLALAAYVFQVGFLTHNDGADVGWSRVPLSVLHGDVIAQALLDAHVEVRLNASVQALERLTDSSVRVRTASGDLDADAVVLATSAKVAASLGALDAALPDALGVSPIVNVQFVFDRRVTDLAMAAGVDSPVEFVFDRSDAAGTRSGQCLVVSLSAASSYMSVGSSELIPFFRDALADLFPAVRDARVLSALVTREATATFFARPGIESTRASITSLLPRVALAGAWCDTSWPATMEGAVRSGAQAASEVLSLFSDTIREQAAQRESVKS